MNAIHVNIAVEGLADEMVLRKILAVSSSIIRVHTCYGKKGKDYLIHNLSKFQQSARFVPCLILLDLDEKDECAPILLDRIHYREQEYFKLRIAVREVEAWLLADQENFATFFSIPQNKIPSHPDEISNPKQRVVNLARQSKRRQIREDIVPAEGSTSRVGKNYSGKLIEFIQNYWDIENAKKYSPSLLKAIDAVNKFSP